MKHLFWGYVTKVWIGTYFSSNKYLEHNKMLIKMCIEYYVQYWQRWNEILYNQDELRERTLTWYYNKKEKALNRRKIQVRNYILQNDIDISKSKTEYIRSWIRGLKKINKRSNELSRNDIRMHFV